MSKLKAVKPKTAVPSHPKILIYGKPGVGKTFGALDFPACYYVDTEGGANLPRYTEKLEKSGGMYFGPEQGSLDFKSIINEVKTLATEKHPYKTLVIDSVSKIFTMEIANEADRLAVAGKKNEFGLDKKPAVAYVRQLMNWLVRLDMNVILISHEKAEWKNGEQIGDTFDFYDKIEYELHLCLQIYKAGNQHMARIRKSRFENFVAGDTFTWSYENFAEKYGKEIIEKSAEPIVLATLEQVTQIQDLISKIKLPEGQEEKWLDASGVKSWSDMASADIAKAITYIEATYLTPTTNKETKNV